MKPETAIRTMKLVLDLPARQLNVRSHWRVRQRARILFFEASDNRQLLGLVARPPFMPWERSRVWMHFRLWNRMDQDNLWARAKDVCDWLRTRGYIANDDPKSLDLTVTQEIDRSNRCVEITLEPVA